MGDKEKKKKDKNSSDRVTLKKEIGLLSACAIIIGECVTVFVLIWRIQPQAETCCRITIVMCAAVALLLIKLKYHGTQ